MRGPRYTEIVRGLPSTVPFVGPETQERARGRAFSARLGANENVFGPSPHAVTAMQTAASDVWKYGDPENHDLRHALAHHHQVAPDNIMIGEGIDALLGYLVRLLIAPKDRVVTSAGAYPTFNFHVAGFGGDLIQVPYSDDAENPQALVAKADQTGAKLVYFANPDNPMGSWHTARKVADAINRLPDGCVMVLDEAYIEFAQEGTAPPLDTDNSQVIRMRTFSKAYGMAGARIGYAIAHQDLINAFNKIRNHFGVSRIAQAGALAALADQKHLNDTIARVAEARDRIATIAGKNGLIPLPSATNFVSVDCGRDGDFARKVLNGLISKGIFVRMPFVSPQDRCIRISAGTQDDLDRLEKALPIVLQEVSD